jgi:hypothetical protein
MKRSVRTLILLPLIPGAYLSTQRTCYERNPKNGSLLRIPPQTIILPARPTTREQHPGFSKVEFTKSGRSLLHLSGSTENVPFFLFASLHPTDCHPCSRLREKRFMVRYFSLSLPASTKIITQLWYNRRRHGPKRSRIVDCGLLLL